MLTEAMLIPVVQEEAASILYQTLIIVAAAELVVPLKTVLGGCVVVVAAVLLIYLLILIIAVAVAMTAHHQEIMTTLPAPKRINAVMEHVLIPPPTPIIAATAVLPIALLFVLQAYHASIVHAPILILIVVAVELTAQQ